MHNSGIFLDSILSIHFTSSSPLRTILLSNLDSSKKYDLIFVSSYGSRFGSPEDIIVRYTVDTVSDTVLTVRNVNDSASLIGLTPDENNEISIDITRDAGSETHINALQIIYY